MDRTGKYVSSKKKKSTVKCHDLRPKTKKITATKMEKSPFKCTVILKKP